MQTMSPSASKRGAKAAPSSISSFEPRKAKGFGSPIASSCLESPRAAQQREELELFGRVVAEDAGELGRHGRRAGLLDPAHGHAHMLGFEENGDAARLE